jgi:hypothetical protein
MATKLVKIRPKGTGDYADVLHPETSASVVKMNDGTTVEDKITSHLAKAASTSASGHVQLQTTVDTSETTALTPKALNTHLADTANPHNVTKTQIGLGNVDNVSALSIRTDTSKSLRAEVKSSAPSSPVNGQIWYDSANHKFKGYANGAWV